MSENKTLNIKEQNKSAASSLLKKNVRKFMRNRLAVFGLVVVLIMTLACVGAAVAGIDYSPPNLPAMKQAPSAEHIFGTDTIGRDLFAHVLFGGCYSIFIGVFCAVLSSIIGAILGTIAGYFGKGSEWVIVRISEIFLAFPQLVLITHNMGMVAEMADEVCVMYMGRVVEFGSLEDVFDRTSHPYTKALLRSVPVLGLADGQKLETIPGATPNPADLKGGCEFADRCSECTAACREGRIPMYEIEPGHRVRCLKFAGSPLAEEEQAYATAEVK